MAAPERRVLIAAIVAAAALPAAALAADPNEPAKHHTAADTRIATRIALTRSDFVAGWKRIKTDNSSDACKGEPNESKLVETADVDPTFESKNGAVDIDSEVQIFRTAAMSRRDWSLQTLARLRTCAKDEFRRQLGKSATFSLVRTKPPVVRGVQTESFRLVIHATVKGTRVVVASDMIALHLGRVSVGLTAIGPQGSYRPSVLTPFAGVLAHRLLAAAA